MSASDRGFKYEAIAHRLEEQIRRKVYRFGEQIPSIRQLCRIERASPGSVYHAMGILEARGLIEARPKSGYYVSARVGSPSALLSPPPGPEGTEPCVPCVVGVSDIVAEVMREAHHPGLVPLGAALPDPGLLPTEKLSRLTASVVRGSPSMLGRYELSPGHPELIRQLEKRFYAMGCPVAGDEIVVSNGATEALNLAIRAVTRPGDVVAVESPTYFGLLEILESLGLRTLRIPGDREHGIDLAKLADALERHSVKAVALIPSFNNPTGTCLSEERRAQLMAIVEKAGVALIEDDLYGDLHFTAKRTRPVKAFDRSGRVIYCSSVSKMLSPGLRVGWVAAGRYAERIRRLKWISSLYTPPVNQLVIARFLASEGMNRHLRRFRSQLQEQMTAMRHAIADHFPSGTMTSEPQGGMFLWVRLPGAISGVELYRRLLREGILIMPDRVFCPVTEPDRSIRLSCGLPFTEPIRKAIARIGELVHEAAAGYPKSGNGRR